jgi:small subunit ribosomal protein S9
MASTSNKPIAVSIGRRKSSRAAVRLHSGKGLIVVNGKPADEYFTNLISIDTLTKPLTITQTDKKYDVSARVVGGGLTGQSDALILGISRALVIINEKNKPLLRQYGLLTRDPRERQRRMVGMGGKSRRKKQSPKR